MMNGGMTINMKHKFLSILLTFAILFPSAAFAQDSTEEWELSGSWDFTENVNNGFTVNKAVTSENGEGKLH